MSHADAGVRAAKGWDIGDRFMYSKNSSVWFFYTWKGETFDFYEGRLMRDLLYSFGIQPAAAFG